MVARISSPAKTATQSGKAKTARWLLQFEPASAREIDPLMGWTSSGDMDQQVKLWFDSKEEAIAYAERHGLPYVVSEPHRAGRVTASYSDNFKTSRVGPCTH